MKALYQEVKTCLKVEAVPGCSVHDCARDMAELAEERKAIVVCEFNGTLITVDYMSGDGAAERAVGRWSRDRDTGTYVRLQRIEAAARDAVVELAAAMAAQP